MSCMKSIKQAFSGEKIKLFKHPPFDYILIIVIWFIGNYVLINHTIGVLTKETTTIIEFLELAFFNILFCCILATSLRACIIVDLREETIIFNELGLKKTKLPLSDITGIALTVRDNQIIINICKSNYEIHDLYAWSVGKKGMGPTLTETFDKRKMRYQKFADEVNAIIRERYPDNKPINYDESDEW